MSYAYVGKAAAATVTQIPTGWPTWWTYPPNQTPAAAPGSPWPPGWPYTYTQAGVTTPTLSVDAASTTTIGIATPLTCRVLDGGLDTSALVYHAIKVTATLNGATCQLKKESGDSFADQVYFLVTNYTGSRYGIDSAVILDADAGDDGDTATITCTLVTLTPEFSGSDTTVLGTSIVWTDRSAAQANSWLDVCWSPALSLFVAVAGSGTNRVMTSPDGVTWTARSSADDGKVWTGVCWSPQLAIFVAVGGGTGAEDFMTSADGISWTGRTPATSNQVWEAVCWSPETSLFVAVGQASALNISSDGINWTAVSAPSGSKTYRDICWAADIGLFVAVAATGTNRVMTSSNGLDWTARTEAVAQGWTSVDWSPTLGLFAAVANVSSGQRVMTSPDGITWTGRDSSSLTQWNQICWAETRGAFVAVSGTIAFANHGAMFSGDGITWTDCTGDTTAPWQGLCWSPDLELFVAVGNAAVMTGV